MASSAPRYARAFAEVAESARLDANTAQQQMSDFAQTLAGSNELREILQNPSLEMAAKLKVLDAIAGRIAMFPQVRNFIAVILEHHRLAELDEILTEYKQVVDEHAGATEARITSARPLNAGGPRAVGGADREAGRGARSRPLRGGRHASRRRGCGDRIDRL